MFVEDDATALLVKGGFIRQVRWISPCVSADTDSQDQAHSGIYHYLPLAQKLEQSLEKKLEWHLETMLGE